MSTEDLIEKARLAFVEAWERANDSSPIYLPHPAGTRSRAGIEAAFAVFAAVTAESVRAYWDANGELIDSHNGARLAFEAVAAHIEAGM